MTKNKCWEEFGEKGTPFILLVVMQISAAIMENSM